MSEDAWQRYLQDLVRTMGAARAPEGWHMPEPGFYAILAIVAVVCLLFFLSRKFLRQHNDEAAQQQALRRIDNFTKAPENPEHTEQPRVIVDRNYNMRLAKPGETIPPPKRHPIEEFLSLPQGKAAAVVAAIAVFAIWRYTVDPYRFERHVEEAFGYAWRITLGGFMLYAIYAAARGVFAWFDAQNNRDDPPR